MQGGQGNGAEYLLREFFFGAPIDEKAASEIHVGLRRPDKAESPVRCLREGRERCIEEKQSNDFGLRRGEDNARSADR